MTRSWRTWRSATSRSTCACPSGTCRTRWAPRGGITARPQNRPVIRLGDHGVGGGGTGTLPGP
eukprot:scaffold4956_cov62-Isochrysis_galbana.AAC.1